MKKNEEIIKGLKVIRTCIKNVEVTNTIELLNLYKKIVEELKLFIKDLKDEESITFNDIDYVLDVTSHVEQISLLENLGNNFIKNYNSLVKKIKKTKKELSSQTIKNRKNKTIKEINELIKTI